MVVVNYLPLDKQATPPTVQLELITLDVDPDTDGTQVVEGSSVAVKAIVGDECPSTWRGFVGRWRSGPSHSQFPFNLGAAMPKLSGAKTTATIQLRATDTGGNVTYSDISTLQLVVDNTPPVVRSIDPSDGAKKGRSFRTIRLDFSESMDPATFIPSSFLLVDQNSAAINPISIQSRNNDRQVLVSYERLPVGSYTFSGLANRLTRTSWKPTECGFKQRCYAV